jgi:hypothetical protein
MFERYTEGARRTIFFGRYEASQFGSPEIDTVHILLGILRDDKELARQVLPNVDYDSVNQELARQSENEKARVSTSVDLPLSEDAKRAMVQAADEADRLKSKYIGTEHLLLGLIHEPEFASTKLLQKVVGLEALRKRIEALPPRRPQRQPAPAPRPASEVNAVVVHGFRRNIEALRTATSRLKEHPFYWERKLWQARDVVFEKNGKRFSFDISLAKDSEKFILVKGGWKKDLCAICRWELFESEDPSHGTGYTNGSTWVCEECYRRFIDRDFFSSAYSELT